MTTESTAYDGALLVPRYAPLSDAIFFFSLFIYLLKRQLFSTRVLIPSSGQISDYTIYKYLIMSSVLLGITLPRFFSREISQLYLMFFIKGYNIKKEVY